MATMVIADMTRDEIERTFCDASALLLTLPRRPQPPLRRRLPPRRRASLRDRRTPQQAATLESIS